MQRGLGIDSQEIVLVDTSPLRVKDVSNIDSICVQIIQERLFNSYSDRKDFSSLDALGWDQEMLEKLLNEEPIWRVPGNIQLFILYTQIIFLN